MGHLPFIFYFFNPPIFLPLATSRKHERPGRRAGRDLVNVVKAGEGLNYTLRHNLR
jgi:hypothetical protein